jgi:imidazole glycerol-phosphate synthase subunit HisH
MITIVDYDMGNPGSIKNMLERSGSEATISSKPSDVLDATKLILPGVGKFDAAMRNLQALGLVAPLHEKVIEQKTPILGICLGMQLFTHGSEEGSLPGFGWIDADTIKFSFDTSDANRVPHMGWNVIGVEQPSAILDEQFNDSRFYFVHSFHVRCRRSENVLASTDYGIRFHSAIIQENILGTQFHPEKSHKHGLRLMRNFAEAA